MANVFRRIVNTVVIYSAKSAWPGVFLAVPTSDRPISATPVIILWSGPRKRLISLIWKCRWIISRVEIHRPFELHQGAALCRWTVYDFDVNGCDDCGDLLWVT